MMVDWNTENNQKEIPGRRDYDSGLLCNNSVSWRGTFPRAVSVILIIGKLYTKYQTDSPPHISCCESQLSPLPVYQ